MATAKWRSQHDEEPIKLLLTQDEADLIRSVFGDLYTTKVPTAPFGRRLRERDIVTNIFDALAGTGTTRARGYDLSLGKGGLESGRPKF